MVYANPYFRFSKLTEPEFCTILECFAKDLTATRTAEITGISVRSANAIFLRIRQRSAECCEIPDPWLPGSPAAGHVPGGTQRSGEVEVLGCRNMVIGLLDRSGRIHTEIAPQHLKPTLQALIRGHLTLQSVIRAGNWRGYDGLVDLEFDRFFRVNQDGHGSPQGDRDGIEAFWRFSEKRLRKFHGLSGKTFWLHLKECEFRFNHREQDLFSILRTHLRRQPL